MKLVLARRDFVRMQILSRKISRKHLNEKGLESMKIEFYHFMVKYYVHEKMHLDVAKSYQTIYDTYNKAEADLNLDPQNQLKPVAFQNFTFYLMLSPYSNERVDLLNIVDAMYQRELD
jgi:26S proteasome regulatory subunit N5